MPTPPGPRRRWLKWLGAAVLLLLGVIGFTALRLWWQHRQHHELRDAEIGRAPVVAPKPNAPVTPRLPTAIPKGTTCVQGLVSEGRGGSPIAGMQVSLPDAERKGTGPCSGPCDAERLGQLLTSPRLGLLEPMKSATTGADGRFVLCGLGTPLPSIIFGEHADGRVALPLDVWAPIQPGVDLALGVPALLPVTGVVRLSDGRPVKGRLLLYPLPSVLVRDVTSDEAGHFTALLPAGSVTVVVAREGQPPVEATAFVAHRQPLLVTISEPFSLTVRALSKGQPVPGAEVVVGGSAPQPTDAKGELTLTITNDNQQHIVVTKGELIGSVRRFGRLERAMRVDVDLSPGLRVKGSVIDEKGQGRIAEVTGLPGGKVETDANGLFVSPLLPKETLHLHANVEGCAGADKAFEPAPGRPVLLEVRCEPTLTGMVLDAEGNPLANAAVSIQGAEFEGQETKPDGHFALHVPKGAYQLTVEHRDYRTEQRPITVPAKDVAVVLDAGGSLSGKVVDEKGQPIAGADVTVFPGVIDELLREAEGGSRARDTTADDGSFRLKGLLAGRWIIVVDGASLPPTPSEPLVLQPGEHKTGVVVKVGGTVDLSGTVLDEQHRPVPGARVKWEPTDEKSALTSVILDVVAGRMEEAVRFLPTDVITGIDGRFELKNVQVKDVTVSAFATGYDSAEAKTTRGSTIELVLHGKTKGRVKGHVVDEAGRAVTRFQVNGEQYANDPGEFEVEDDFGNVFLHFTAPGFSSKNVEVKLEKAEHDLGAVALERGVPFTVKVSQEDGKPLERSNVFAKSESTAESCVTKPDGTCTIDTLRDEATKVTVTHSGFLEKVVEVGTGQRAKPLEVVLSAAGGRAEGVVFAAPGRPAIARRLTVSATGDTDFVLTDENGHFSATGLPEGPGCVTFELSGLLGTEWSVPLTLSTAPTPVTVGPMEHGGVLVTKSMLPGRVVVLGGAAGPLKATDVGNGAVSSLCIEKRVPVISYVSTGEGRLEGLPPGKWSVYILAVTEFEETKQLAPHVVDLAPGETKRVP